MNAETTHQRLVIGISGATGIIYGIRALALARSLDVETHLVVSRAAQLTRAYETDLSKRDLYALADHVWSADDLGAPPASGSFPTLGMLIAPASMRTVAEIASGVSSSLLTRAADVTLKERRTLVVLARETPLSLIHLRNLTTVVEAGGVVFPPVPAFYAHPQSLLDVVDHTVGRALAQFGLRPEGLPVWDQGYREFAARLHDQRTNGSSASEQIMEDTRESQ